MTIPDLAFNMPFCITKPWFYAPSRDKARDCLKKAIQTYKKKKLLFILQATRLYKVLKTIFYNRKNRRCDQALYNITKLKLILQKKVNEKLSIRYSIMKIFF